MNKYSSLRIFGILGLILSLSLVNTLVYSLAILNDSGSDDVSLYVTKGTHCADVFGDPCVIDTGHCIHILYENAEKKSPLKKATIDYGKLDSTGDDTEEIHIGTFEAGGKDMVVFDGKVARIDNDVDWSDHCKKNYFFGTWDDYCGLRFCPQQ